MWTPSSYDAVMLTFQRLHELCSGVIAGLKGGRLWQVGLRGQSCEQALQSLLQPLSALCSKILWQEIPSNKKVW